MITSISKFLIGKSTNALYLWKFLKKIGIKENHYIEEDNHIFLSTEKNQLLVTLEINNDLSNNIKIYTLFYKQNVIAITTQEDDCTDSCKNMEVKCDVLFNLKGEQAFCFFNNQRSRVMCEIKTNNGRNFVKQELYGANKIEVVKKNSRKMVHSNELLPSEFTGHYWLFATSHIIPLHQEELKIGKWMVFSSPNEVDERWKKVKFAVANGQLWKAKVACVNPNYEKQVIIVYCPYSDDINEVAKTYRTLVELDIASENQIIKYKTDEQTLSGEYGKNAYIYTSENFKDNNFAFPPKNGVI